MFKTPDGTVRAFGWRPQLPDIRDRVFQLPLRGVPPESVDLSSLMPPILDQGRIGSCVSNAISTAIQYLREKDGKKKGSPSSRLFNYWNTREMEQTIPFDAGAIIRDSIKVIATLGAPPEWRCRYSDVPPSPQTNMWTLKDKPRKKPGPTSYEAGLARQTISYEVIPRDLVTMQSCLAAGFPFVFGFSVYESFLSQHVATTGEANLPAANERMVGGHAVVCVGYDNSTKRFRCQNSWGLGWGNKGFFTLPYGYMVDLGLASDLWTIRFSE